MRENIKVILFDSGRVLNKPATGHWFIPPQFFKYVDPGKYNSLPDIKVKYAFQAAGKYISRQNLIQNETEEFTYFLEYYRIFSDNLPELGLNAEEIKCIAKDLVFNTEKYQFFKDVRDTVATLSKRYKLAIVSDAWPSLENVFKKAGLRDYFSSFIISSRIGVTKPNALMYQSALWELNVSPEEAVFIDDNLKNCQGAKQLGIEPVLLCRSFKAYILNRLAYRDYRVIKDLYQLSFKIL